MSLRICIFTTAACLCLFYGSYVLAGDNANRRVDWMNAGPLIGGGGQEAFIFRIRRGGAGPYEEEWRRFLEEHTEEYVQAYKKAGMEVFHTHGYKGFGYQAELPEMKLLKDLSKLVHKNGMRLSVYCQGMTLAPENFFAEVPESRQWYQVDALGQPVMLNYGYQQSFRYKPNIAHPGYRKYFKEKIVRTLVQDCSADMLFIDNFESNREPESDHSPVTVEAFHKYLRDKYSRGQLLERFGHANVDLIGPPLWNRENDPAGIGEIQDPALQEWIDFRCWLHADWLRDVAEYARSLNPEVSVTTNPHGIFGTNRALQVGIWHPWFLKYTEATFSEEENLADFNDKGVVVSKIRTFKLGRAFGNYILTNKLNERSFAEALAFGARYPARLSLWHTRDGYQLPDPEKKYLDFYLAHRELYQGTRAHADVAVLRSYPSMAYSAHRADLEVSMVEQALIQAHVPFDIIFDEQMDSLERYRALILAGQNNLSTENVERIERFARSGGGLLVNGASGTCDNWGRRLSRPALADLLGQASFQSRRRSVGQQTSSASGRRVYLPRVIPSEGVDPNTWPGAWDGGWVLPVNWRQIASAACLASGGSLSTYIDLPEWIAAEITEKPGQVQAHFVNYREGYKHGEFNIEVAVPAGARVREVRLVSPDRAAEQTLAFNQGGGYCSCAVPGLDVYDVVVIELEGK